MAPKTSWRTVQMLIDELGAEFLVNPPAFVPFDRPILKALAQLKVNKRLSTDDCKYLFPDPYSATRVTIVWDHFHPHRSFPRSTLRTTLGSGHVYEDDVAHVWAVPRDLGRPPLASEVAEYRSRTLDAIEAADCPHVLLLGKAAIGLWRDDLGPMKVAGGTFVWGNRWVYPTIHPSAIAMDANNLAIWREGMRALAHGIFADQVTYGQRCIDCQAHAVVYDKCAVPYCRDCFKLGNVATREKKWQKKQNQAAQPALGL